MDAKKTLKKLVESKMTISKYQRLHIVIGCSRRMLTCHLKNPEKMTAKELFFIMSSCELSLNELKPFFLSKYSI